MKRIVTWTALGAVVAFVACASQQKAPAMTEYEQARATDYAKIVEQRFPELYKEAQVHHAKATAAYKDKEEEVMKHHAEVSLTWWQAGKTASEAVDLQEQTVKAKNDLKAAETQLAKLQKRHKDAEAAVARLEKIIALEGKLGDSEGANKARQALNDALAAMKAAEAVNARIHAPEKFGEAEAKFHAATGALESGKLKDSQSLAIEAKVAAESAKKASAGKYKSEQATLAYEARRRELFDATAEAPGVERSITEGGVMLTIREVFPTNKVEIDPSRFDTFNKLAKIAGEYSEFSLVIEGHTDSKGKDSKNLALSEGRAKAVMSYLSQQGVQPNRMTAIGKGEGEPVAENTSKAGRAQNRRIEILFAQGPPPK